MWPEVNEQIGLQSDLTIPLTVFGPLLFAPASPDRPRVVPGTRAAAGKMANGCGEPSGTDRQRNLTWAQPLKRVFAIDVEVCRRCGGKLRVIELSAR
jgi:hypothetical protein